MAEQIVKLSPDRDLQCYFLTPSAVAAMSDASSSGFTVSGTWRQQFDWAVVEWSRDNVFEHPTLRYLPDGDLSGLTLSYDEQRAGCIPIESNLAPTVDWNNLRIWAADANGTEQLYHVNLWPSCAVPVEGEYVPATASMTLVASPGEGKRVGIALLDFHHYWTVRAGDDLDDIARGIAADIQSNPDFTAVSSGATVTVTWKAGPNYAALVGENGNRLSLYGFAQDGVNCWEESHAQFSGGQFPSKYRVTVDFGALKTEAGIPTNKIRKLRWTWAADMQTGSFAETEFCVTVSNWSVTGPARVYSFAGPGSRRIESNSSTAVYTGSWRQELGNYSGGSIHVTSAQGDSVQLTYSETAAHDLYVGTRLLSSGGILSARVDGEDLGPISQALAGEDILVRRKVASLPAGTHSVLLTNVGPQGSNCYFDFVEIAYAVQSLPDYPDQGSLSLATDWDTYHSQSLPAERTAWLIQKLGFKGRVNHYVGALWFCELVRQGTRYSTCSIFVPPQPYVENLAAVLSITPTGSPGSSPTPTLIKHLVLQDDTPETIALAFKALVNLNTNLLWADASGTLLSFTAREMGVLGDGISVELAFNVAGTQIGSTPATLAGGVDGDPYELDGSNLGQVLASTASFWKTDTSREQPINRAARDWHRAYFRALNGYGIEVVAAFSTELLNADPSSEAGFAQRYPDGSPVVLNTPAIQTNFSLISLSYWTKAYVSMAQLQVDAGLAPYLQSGEVQWWYFPKQQWNPASNSNVDVGMPFYDAYTLQQFEAAYGKSMRVIANNGVDPTHYPEECALLPGLIGKFTASIRQALNTCFPGCRYEVLYPTDTNDTPLNRVINYPVDDWTPGNLTCLKTESFTFTGNCDLDHALGSVQTSAARGFPPASRSHLVGIGVSDTPWTKEASIALSEGLESVVLFALDQFCLIGYANPISTTVGSCQRRI